MKDKPYPLQIQTSAKRKSIGICVYPTADVKVYVPTGTTQARIEEVIKSKEKWIIEKIEGFKANKIAEIKKKEYVSGESFYYLGKQYKLRIVDGKTTKIELARDTILLHKASRSNIKNIIGNWFLDQAKEVFEERLKFNFEVFAKQYKYDFPTLKLRKMKSRWGSMSNKGNMTLNSHLIHTPVECIDYVIMHELCHLKYKNHGTRFYQLQFKLTPRYKELKNKLESFAVEIKLL
jgi:predicted metal-dependent hydrolase